MGLIGENVLPVKPWLSEKRTQKLQPETRKRNVGKRSWVSASS